jgi:hypothetical protein
VILQQHNGCGANCIMILLYNAISPVFRFGKCKYPAIPRYCAMVQRNEMQICFLSLAKCCALRPRIGLSQEVPKPWGGMAGDCTDNFIDAGAITWILYSD